MPLFNILNVYVIFLLLIPPFFYLYQHSALAACLLSLSMYAGVQVLYYQTSPVVNALTGPFFGNPLAWQFLFFLGIALGIEQVKQAIKIPRRLLLGVAVLVYCLAIDFLHQTEFAYFHFSNKEHLGLLRILDLLLVVYAVHLFVPRRFSTGAQYAAPFVNLGRNSLPVFCVSVFISYAGSLSLLALPTSRGVYLAVIVIAVSALLLLGAHLGPNTRVECWLNLKLTRIPRRDGQPLGSPLTTSALAKSTVATKRTMSAAPIKSAKA